MRPSYQVIFPFVADMGSIQPLYVHPTPTESKEEQALWYLNKMREHDNLRPLRCLPEGTIFDRMD